MELSPETQLRTLQLLRAIWGEVDSPAEVGTSPDASQQSLLYAEALARRLGLIPGSGTGMAIVTTSIGTDSRDYSTMTSWESDLDNAGVYSSSDVAQGECYNDSVFDETFTINGGGTVGLSGRILTAASGEEHDGTAGTGVRISPTSNFSHIATLSIGPTTVSNIEFTQNTSDGRGAVASSVDTTVSRLLCYGFTRIAYVNVIDHSGDGKCVNNIIYDIEARSGTSQPCYGIRASSGSDDYVMNNTVHDVRNDGTGDSYNISFLDRSDDHVKNNLATSPGGSGGGSHVCYSLSSPSNADTATNLSSDATSPDGASYRSITTADQFVSIVGGSEDLHLKTGADAIGAGTDLGTTPTGVNFDIDGRDRDAEGDAWDIGADQYVAAGGGSILPMMMQLNSRRNE